MSETVGSVVYITDTIGNDDYQASGVLIAPDVVLTASHVVYTQGVGTATNIEVTPGYEPGSQPYGTVSGKVLDYNPIQDAGDSLPYADSQNDFALILLSGDVGAPTMTLDDQDAGTTVDATVTGYPADKRGEQISSSETFEPFADTGFAAGNGDLSLYVAAGLGDGSSGGPVWIDGSNGPEVIGLVSSGLVSSGLLSSGTGTTGFFVEITPAVENTVHGWLEAAGLACFRQGTRIATARGEVAVEALTADDIIPTHFGAAARIGWLGHRRIDCRRHKRPQDVWPVRVAAHAFGEQRPRRDLWLSPDHAVFIDDVLIPIRCLINGTTIVPESCDEVIYWHVELARHDVLLAEGLPAESYLDTGNRGAFDNASGPVMLHADFMRQAWDAATCARQILGGPELDIVQRRVRVQAMLLCDQRRRAA